MDIISDLLCGTGERFSFQLLRIQEVSAFINISPVISKRTGVISSSFVRKQISVFCSPISWHLVSIESWLFQSRFSTHLTETSTCFCIVHCSPVVETPRRLLAIDHKYSLCSIDNVRLSDAKYYWVVSNVDSNVVQSMAYWPSFHTFGQLHSENKWKYTWCHLTSKVF